MYMVIILLILDFHRLETNFDNYKEQVKKCVKDSLSVVYDSPTIDDPHYITFSPYNSEIHDPIKQEIYNPKVTFHQTVNHMDRKMFQE